MCSRDRTRRTFGGYRRRGSEGYYRSTLDDANHVKDSNSTALEVQTLPANRNPPSAERHTGKEETSPFFVVGLIVVPGYLPPH